MRPTRENILAYMKSPGYRPLRIRELSRALKVPQASYREFRRLVKEMVASAELVELRRNRYALPGSDGFLIGPLQGHQGGFGFVTVSDEEPDVFISRSGMGRALHGDTVMVKLQGRRRGVNPEGKIVRVVERGRDPVVGTFRQESDKGLVTPDDPRIVRDIAIGPGSSKGARTGQKVVVQVTAWKSGLHNPEGRVSEVLGFPDDPNLEILSLIRGYNLPLDFPAPVLEETMAISDSIPESVIEGRLDLRATRCITIDPAQARDFDDAVSIEVLEGGGWRLGVHIADVSAYVSEGSLIDREALYRGTSVYLIDRVIPMLPHRLTNEICSLNPNEDRLALTVSMDINNDGTVDDYTIRESVIRSTMRLTYKNAQEILDGAPADGDVHVEIGKDLHHLRALSRCLFKRRIAAGSFDFDLPEPLVELDTEGAPVDVGKEVRLDSNRLIEECMLASNRTVARHLLSNEIPAVYRIHERPKGEKLEDLLNLLTGYGYQLTKADVSKPVRLQKFMTSIQDHPEHIVINDLIIRSMQKARYSVDNRGHYGLAFKEYTHFTSPIRRYPDLAIHRLLKESSRQTFSLDRLDHLERSLVKTAEISSRREKLAEEVERESIKIKQAEYMEGRIDETFDGVISGVVPSGLFVELVESLIDGMVPVGTLTDDYYHFDRDRRQLMGERTRNVYRLGQKVRIRVVRADRRLRKIDFELLSAEKIAPADAHRLKRVRSVTTSRHGSRGTVPGGRKRGRGRGPHRQRRPRKRR